MGRKKWYISRKNGAIYIGYSILRVLNVEKWENSVTVVQSLQMVIATMEIFFLSSHLCAIAINICCKM
jgi:hypothetical protein